MRNQGCVEARDLTEYKVDLIRENVQRAGVSCVVPKVKDAEQLDAEWIGKADVVIADLPCTGYGVIGRKPDIKRKRRGAGTDSAGNPCKCRIVRKAGRHTAVQHMYR